MSPTKKYIGILATAFLFLLSAVRASAAIAWVQDNFFSGYDSSCPACLIAGFGASNVASDTIVLAIGFATSTSITSVTDTSGNTYAQMGTTFTVSLPADPPSYGFKCAAYYAKNIASNPANSITVTFDASTTVSLPELYFEEYSGVDATAPIDSLGSGLGYGVIYINTAAPQLISAGDMLVGFFINSAGGIPQNGAGFTTRDTNHNNLVEDRIINIQGYYNADMNYAGLGSNFCSYGVALKPVADTSTSAFQGALESTTFDFGSQAQLNSLLWHGASNGGQVQFQFATSNATSGPWNYTGSDGTSNSYYTPFVDTSLKLDYSLYNNYRYFRYKASFYGSTLSARVDDVVVNWSP